MHLRAQPGKNWVEMKMKILRKDGTIQGKKGKDRFFAAAKTIFDFRHKDPHLAPTSSSSLIIMPIFVSEIGLGG